MIALLVVASVLLLTVAMTKQRKPGRIGYVERTARGHRPLPPMSRRQRLHLWMALYGQTTLEQQIEPGAWPFIPSAVHLLPRGQQTDPAQLLAQ